MSLANLTFRHAQRMLAATMKPKVNLGCRYRPDRVEIRNRAEGLYECMNPMADGALSVTELQAQRALLEPLTDPRALARIEMARAARRV